MVWLRRPPDPPDDDAEAPELDGADINAVVGIPHDGLWSRSREHNNELVCKRHDRPLSEHRKATKGPMREDFGPYLPLEGRADSEMARLSGNREKTKK
jgi:hypothetical protein